MDKKNPLERLFLTRNQAMHALSITSVSMFEGLAKGYGLQIKFRSGCRRYYARADVEKILKELQP